MLYFAVAGLVLMLIGINRRRMAPTAFGFAMILGAACIAVFLAVSPEYRHNQAQLEMARQQEQNACAIRGHRGAYWLPKPGGRVFTCISSFSNELIEVPPPPCNMTTPLGDPACAPQRDASADVPDMHVE